MAGNQTDVVSDEMFDTVLSSLATPVFTPNEPAGDSLHELGLCELKIRLLLQDYHNLQRLPLSTEEISGDTNGLRKAVQDMTLKNRALNRRIIQLSSEIEANQAASVHTSNTLTRSGLRLLDARLRSTAPLERGLFTPAFRASSMKLVEFGHFTSVERHLRVLSDCILPAVTRSGHDGLV